MFKNRSFQKAILVLVFLALLVGAFASTSSQTIWTDLVAAGSKISANHRELSTTSQKARPGEEEEPVQAGLPPCSATSGNCKLGPGGTGSLANQMAILIRYPYPADFPG